VALEVGPKRALSNPFVSTKDLLRRLNELHYRLLQAAEKSPPFARKAPAKASPVLETIIRVLEQAERPMRAREIQTEAEALAGAPLLWTSGKAARAAGASGTSPRLTRLRHGIDQSARAQSLRHTQDSSR
jgi:hypothetical protein